MTKLWSLTLSSVGQIYLMVNLFKLSKVKPLDIRLVGKYIARSLAVRWS